MLLNDDYRDMLSALNDAGAEFLIVGAYAMAAHGLPRATGDIDLLVRPSPANALRVWAALEAFNAPRGEVSAEDFAVHDLVFQIGLPPRRIDLLTSISGVPFEQAWENRLVLELDGQSASVVGLDDLIANKLASGREKDLLDAKLLQQFKQRHGGHDAEN